MVRPIRRNWTNWHSLALVVLLALVAWSHRGALADIVRCAFERPDQSHIVLAPLIALWLAWLRRSRLRTLVIRPNPLGPVLIAAGWLMYWRGLQVDFEFGQHLSVLVAGLGCVISVAGFDVIRRFAPAFLALAFALPVPEQIREEVALPLQNLAAGVTYAILQLLGVDVMRASTDAALVITGQEIAVGEACNGMRLVFALFLTVYAFAFSIPLRQGVRVLLLGLSPVVALACNVVRLIPTSMLFAIDPDVAHEVHDISGWIMLPIALVLLLGVLRLIRWVELPVMSFRLAMRT